MNLIFVLLGLFAVFFGFRKVANSLVDEVIEISIDHFSYKVDKDQQIAFFYIAVIWYFVIGLVVIGDIQLPPPLECKMKQLLISTSSTCIG